MADVLQLEREAEALKAEGKKQEAIDKLQELLQVDPHFVRAHLALAILYYQLKDAEKSVAHAEQAVQIEPDDQFNHVALSVTYQRAFELTRDPKYIQLAETARDRSHMFDR
jgi:tetratricopeptide (TPR) repeat protein